jgi:hypothetical protein
MPQDACRIASLFANHYILHMPHLSGTSLKGDPMTNEAPKTPMASTANTPCSATAKQDNALPLSAQLPNPEMLNIEIKKTWVRLSDDEVKLHATLPDLFFAAVKEKYGTDKEEAQKRLAAIKAACGICTADKAA